MPDTNTDLHLEELRRREEEELASILSQKYGATYIDLTRVTINSEAIRIIPEDVARDAEVAAYDLVSKKISLAQRSPANPKVRVLKDELAAKGYTFVDYMVSRASLESAWTRYKDLSFAVETKEGVIDISSKELSSVADAIHSVADVAAAIQEVGALKRAYRISRIVEVVMAGAFAVNASDVHIEPERDDVRIRYRLDGVLQDVARLDTDTHNLLLSRVKLLSGLKLNIHDHAQDGRFSVFMKNAEIEIRTSIIPNAYGETVVMRLLDPETISVPFEGLGMEARLKTMIEAKISSPNGMLLNTGPTGSGKTTTLYACMKKISTPQVKIITIEDPIEYHVQGIVQTQVEKSYTFLQGLRAALRQDPDVIMVGEIRDEEVARTAIDAALTGHFVFSTLHTNNAAGTFPRLADLGVDPKIFGAAINIAMAQRLVRTLCSVCKKQVPLEGAVRDTILRVAEGLRDKSVLPTDTTHIFEPVGCSVCNNTGYKGRLGVFEAVVIDDEMENLLRTLPTEGGIRALQQKKELMLMHEDGVVKILNGITSFDELNRVVIVE
ncbi:MAG: GspE/PulE family protein [Candidatus Pacebacteria bacterium]|nr:GspE/PulE family protein [Candidatus Paceibacterota bacterium]